MSASSISSLRWLAEEGLVFDEEGRPRLTYRARADGRLDATWEAYDKSATLNGVLSRIE